MFPSAESEAKSHYDVIIIGAGGAGMMCAIHAGKRYREVLILDHAAKLGGKILISGGGRCNFTNLGATPNQYVSQNPHFMKSAMSRFTPRDFIEMVEAHGIAYHEKKLGQQFCDESASQIVEMLRKECQEVNARIQLEARILSVKAVGERSFEVRTYEKTYTCESLVIASGGLSIPKIGASGFGYDIAQQFRLKLVERAAALDGFTLNNRDAQSFEGLAGVSADCTMTTNGITFRENLLFTHAGLSGPATLQASLHWRKNDSVITNFVPDQDAFQWFLQKKKQGNKTLVRNLLSELIPARLADRLCALYFEQGDLPLPQVSEKALEAFCKQYLHAWTIVPSGTVGYTKAEVTRGGVDTDELSSKTMEAKKVPGLYFIGEVVDVTGWLGGYNFQWAWASGAAAGNVV